MLIPIPLWGEFHRPLKGRVVPWRTRFPIMVRKGVKGKNPKNLFSGIVPKPGGGRG